MSILLSSQEYFAKPERVQKEFRCRIPQGCCPGREPLGSTLRCWMQGKIGKVTLSRKLLSGCGREESSFGSQYWAHRWLSAVAGPRRNRLSAHYSHGLGLSLVLTLNKTYLRTAYYFTSLYSPILWPDPLDGHWNEYQNQYYLSKFNKLLSKSEFLRPFVGIQNHDIAL